MNTDPKHCLKQCHIVTTIIACCPAQQLRSRTHSTGGLFTANELPKARQLLRTNSRHGSTGTHHVLCPATCSYIGTDLDDELLLGELPQYLAHNLTHTLQSLHSVNKSFNNFLSCHRVYKYFNCCSAQG